ncbi:MAG: carbamoyl phosphate synthase small subunit, partial [Terrimicrobiaceae bacterium]|nr:carbamoyl phosphate synthase small subunit [Terrimicrobiaceae bacterium]
MEVILALEDGTIYHGESFGAPPPAGGEICFNTAMTGYQEVLTDPSYRGQIVAMTCPHIGNTGINPMDLESEAVQVRGFVVEEVCERPSNWRSTGSLSAWLAQHGVAGIQGVDTRALAKRLRTRGAMRAFIAPASQSDAEAAAAARAVAYEGVDFVSEVTCPDAFTWDPAGERSGAWAPGGGSPGGRLLPAPAATRRIAAFDFGIKRNILRMLRRHGFEVAVVPPGSSAEEVLARRPAGVFLSNGPGDPAALAFARDVARRLVGHVPIFGICLGHQILALALG